MGFVLKRLLNRLPAGFIYVIFLAAAVFPACADVINVREFPTPELGARGDGEHNDFPAIRAALTAGMKEGREVFIPEGKYLLEGSIRVDIEGDLIVSGEGENSVLIFARDHDMRFSSRSILRGNLREDAPRKTTIIKPDAATDVKRVQPGDILHINSRAIGETAWRTPVQHISYVTGTDLEKGEIRIEHPLNFDFLMEDESRFEIRRNRGTLQLNNLVFAVGEDEKNRPRPAPLGLYGLSNGLIENVRILGGNAYRVGLTLGNCIDVTLKNIYFDLPRYGVTAGNSRNIKFHNIVCDNARHAIAPGGWSDGIYVDGLRGENNSGIMDSHPSFNVHYNNVISGFESGFSNLRSVGGSVRNSIFVSASESWSGPYFQNIALAEPEIYEEYEFLMENVLWVAPVPVLVRRVGTVIFRNVECRDLAGNRVGAAVDGVERVVFENTLPEKAILPGYRYLPADKWSVAGPFESPYGRPDRSNAAVREGLHAVFGPEEEYFAEGIDFKAEYPGGPEGEKVVWRKHRRDAGFLMREGVNFGLAYDLERNTEIFYAVTHIYSPEEMEGEFFLGCDFFARAWLNGEELFSIRPEEQYAEDGAVFRAESRLPARINLREGGNVLLVKVHGGTGGVSFTASISDPRDLRFSAVPF